MYSFVSSRAFLTYEEANLIEKFLTCLREKIQKILGLFTCSPEEFWKTERERKLKQKGEDLEKIEALVRERELARKEKNFEKADAIRDELNKKGIVLKDTIHGTFWYVGETE